MRSPATKKLGLAHLVEGGGGMCIWISRAGFQEASVDST
jgi:hypothetical protein